VAEKGWLTGLRKNRRKEQERVSNYGGKNGQKSRTPTESGLKPDEWDSCC
jgi:hypothetical protein